VEEFLGRESASADGGELTEDIWSKHMAIRITSKTAWTNLIVLQFSGNPPAVKHSMVSLKLKPNTPIEKFTTAFDPNNHTLVIIPDQPLAPNAEVEVVVTFPAEGTHKTGYMYVQLPNGGPSAGGNGSASGNGSSTASAINFLGEYPVLTTNVDLTNRNGGGFDSGSGPYSGGGGGGVGLARQAQSAIQNVLGRKVKATDPTAFMQA